MEKYRNTRSQAKKENVSNVSEMEKTSENDEVLAERIVMYRKEVEQHTNVSELSLYLSQEGLLDHEDMEYLLSRASNGEKTSRVLDSLADKPNGFTKFLACIKRETDHMGHTYIAALLEGRQYAPESEVQLSAECKQRIDNNIVELKKGIHLSTLVPYLGQAYLPSIYGHVKTQLLTNSEVEKLLSRESKEGLQAKVMGLFVILERKGPVAHSQFARCMHDEYEHLTHRTLYEEIFGDLDLQPTSSLSSSEDDRICKSNRKPKRKNEFDQKGADSELVVAKRSPRWLEMDGPLKGKKYLRLMRLCYRYHHSGQHSALETEVHKIMSNSEYPLEFQALARVELALSYTFQGKNERALQLIEGQDGALLICGKISGNNASFLIGRCMHLLSGLHRYAKQYDKAKDYAMKALTALHCAEPGQESSIANYVNACIFLECLSTGSTTRHPTDVRTIEQCFRSAISHAHLSEIAMYVILPQSHIRLAQLFLGSTQYSSGTPTNPESFRKARDSLDAVDLKVISQRSKSLYYMVESDWYKIKGDVPKAIEQAECACNIAESIQFTLGVSSAQARLESLPTVQQLV